MDIFSIESENYANGKIVNGISEVNWVERYREGGEFTIKGEPTPGLMQDLALGTLISHSDTYDMMMVETHEIDDSKTDNAQLVVTGRTVDQVILEARVSAIQYFYGLKDHATDLSHLYVLGANQTWNQAAALIHDFVRNPIVDSDEQIPNMEIPIDVPLDELDEMRQRTVKSGAIYQQVLDLLASTDKGLRVERPHPGFYVRMAWWIHGGKDLRNSIQFNWLDGDLDSARYLWSRANLRNRAYIAAQYYGTLIGLENNDPDEGWDRRVMFVDAGDYNDFYEGSDPTAEDEIIRMLEARGTDALTKQQKTQIVDAKISKDARWKYRKDYNIGDIVYVNGNYGVSSPMRVTEYAESMDENGVTGFPTLSALTLPTGP